MRHSCLVSDDVVPAQPERSETQRWALSAVGSAVLFTMAAAAVLSLLFGVYSAAVDIWSLYHPEPDVGQLSQSVSDALFGGLLATVFSFLYGTVIALPLGVLFGLANGALARRVRSHRRSLVGVVSLLVGAVAGLALPTALAQSFELSALNVAVGALAALAAGAHLWREQQRGEPSLGTG